MLPYMTMHVKAHKGNYITFYYMFYMIMQGCYWWEDGGTSRPDLRGLLERIIFLKYLESLINSTFHFIIGCKILLRM